MADSTNPVGTQDVGGNQVDKLREEVRKIVRDKPYFMCRRCGGEVFCDFGRMTSTSMDAEMDKANEKYLEDAFVEYITALNNLQPSNPETTLRPSKAHTKAHTSKGGLG